MRDERVEAFTLFFVGRRSHIFLCRTSNDAPVNSSFRRPRREEMHHPEVFGRSASAKVVIR